MTTQNIGIIGLGKMGSNIGRRIMGAGHPLFVYDIDEKNTDALVQEGATGCLSLHDFSLQLKSPRVILLSVPTGNAVDDILYKLDPVLNAGDTLLDLGNSFYKDSQRRAKTLKKRGIFYIDVGVSGGISGAKHGACLMIGGDERAVADLDYLFGILAKDGSYGYFGGSGAGHLVKGFHNLVEYGYIQSLAEGLESLREISGNEKMTPINLETVCDIWSRGSIIESRIVLDAGFAFRKYHSLDAIPGSVHGQTLDEMKRLVRIAGSHGVKIYSARAAIKARLDSQKNPTYSGKIINAIRNIFGGHTDWKR